MGTEVKVTLGRFKLNAIENRPPVESTPTELTLFGQAKVHVQPNDIEFDDPPDECEINRQKDLFGWLVNLRSSRIKPFYAGEAGKERRRQTMAFFDWYDKTEEARLDKIRPNNGWFGRSEGIVHDKHLGEHSFMIYLVTDLVTFDYDQIIEYKNEDNEHYHRCPEGETYHDNFQSLFFNLIECAHKEGFHFIIFGFEC